jgi:hypothetical protein
MPSSKSTKQDLTFVMVITAVLIVLMFLFFWKRDLPNPKEKFTILGRRARHKDSYTRCTNLCDSMQYQGFRGPSQWCLRGCDNAMDKMLFEELKREKKEGYSNMHNVPDGQLSEPLYSIVNRYAGPTWSY